MDELFKWPGLPFHSVKVKSSGTCGGEWEAEVFSVSLRLYGPLIEQLFLAC